ncbi:hypothetical protein P7K49_000318 [Saguinus oedipus]|uniref:Uncharacterized protein n=1 Tax=Saguinus oedipus TaxID=9490 RepID=A0ABQ9WBF0_SAGOE|nr:hypothetical protein P7K49_000318 [Saguinus oedipus]
MGSFSTEVGPLILSLTRVIVGEAEDGSGRLPARSEAQVDFLLVQGLEVEVVGKEASVAECAVVLWAGCVGADDEAWAESQECAEVAGRLCEEQNRGPDDLCFLPDTGGLEGDPAADAWRATGSRQSWDLRLSCFASVLGALGTAGREDVPVAIEDKAWESSEAMHSQRDFSSPCSALLRCRSPAVTRNPGCKGDGSIRGSPRLRNATFKPERVGHVQRQAGVPYPRQKGDLKGF